LTETREFQAAAAAVLLRFSGAFLIATYVVTSVARETGDRGLELALTLPISRLTYYAGKLAGFACCGALLAMAFAMPLLLWSPPAAVAMWCASLAMETALGCGDGALFLDGVERGPRIRSHRRSLRAWPFDIRDSGDCRRTARGERGERAPRGNGRIRRSRAETRFSNPHRVAHLWVSHAH
jgi:hypothetical protein